MDRTRSFLLRQLKAANLHDRLHAYVPVTEEGRIIIVHAKLSIIDDTLLRIGSANLNNRSGGFDTECDLSLEARLEDTSSRETIAGLRTRLLAHWLGCPPQVVASAIAAAGGRIGAGVERLRQGGHKRLLPLEPKAIGPFATLIASYHIGDPTGTADSWRPWKRKRALAARLAQVSADEAE
jgi:phosphatidylserine/phosphatidylglycerophosphate/cardiolipin synthase-like enzyme